MRSRATSAALAVGALAVAVGAFSVAGHAGASATACKTGTKKVAGGRALIFCSAKATVTANGKTYAVKNGECDLYPKYVVVSIGSVANAGSYFGLFVGQSPVAPATEPVAARDGTYKNGLLLLATPRVLAFLFDETDLKVTLKMGRRSGTFSGSNPADPRLKRPKVHVSGSFRC